MRRFVGVVVSAVLLSGCWSTDDNDMLDRTNRYRAGFGLPAVARDDFLHDAACRRAGELIETGRLAHDPAGILASMAGYGRWRWVAEDLGVSGTTGEVFSAFVGSPTHRAVLLDERWERAGICVLRYAGAVWVVARFTD